MKSPTGGLILRRRKGQSCVHFLFRHTFTIIVLLVNLKLNLKR